ncbi:hypothetical protein [Ramlibacter sp.]|uniref:hypothetical protein n=1 Tax=Ramlibacter sp. TaxID=1917967 RepID=UPI0026051EF1|nr:hypothetical protein [Ramlibacter sp.]MDB5957701.1 hypothetical protein [Ramlibacter sp.]
MADHILADEPANPIPQSADALPPDTPRTQLILRSAYELAQIAEMVLRDVEYNSDSLEDLRFRPLALRINQLSDLIIWSLEDEGTSVADLEKQLTGLRHADGVVHHV